MKKILLSMRKLRKRVNNNDVNEVEALNIIKNNLKELSKENLKNVELITITEELKKLEAVKQKSKSLIESNTFLDSEYRNLLLS